LPFWEPGHWGFLPSTVIAQNPRFSIFEELPPDLITTLGLVAVRPSISKINMDNSHERRDLL
jgi:hypothetical protein